MIVVSTTVVASAFLSHAVADIVDNICFDSMPESEQECNAYVVRLEEMTKPSGGDLVDLGRSLVGLSVHTKKDAEKFALLNSAIGAYEEALSLDPRDFRAKFELALVSPPDIQLRLLKEVSVENPEYVPAIRSLARVVFQFGSEDELSELIHTLENSYRAVDRSSKLYVATLVYKAYVDTGNVEGARMFVGMAISKQISELEPKSLLKAEQQLAFVCNYSAFLLGLNQSCLYHVRLIAGADVDKLESDASPLLQAIQQLLTQRHELQTTNPDIQIELRDILEDIKKAGADSLQFYLAYSIVLSGDRRIEALRRAAEIEGNNNTPGQGAYWLGESLVEAETIAEAIDIFGQVAEHGVSPYAGLAATHKERLEQQLSQ